MSFMGDGSDNFPETSEDAVFPAAARRRSRRSLPGPLGALQSKWRRLRRKQRRLALLASGGVLLLVVVLFFVLLGRGGDDLGDDWPVLDFEDEPVTAAAPALGVPADQIPGDVPAGVPADVAAIVEATVTAIRLQAVTPTPEPTPTISVAATVRARIFTPFSGSPDSDLDRHELRSAYLSQSDVDALEGLGPDLWLGSLSFVAFQEILLRDRLTYTYEFLSSRSDIIESLVLRFSLDSSVYRVRDSNPLVSEFFSRVSSAQSLIVQASAMLKRLAALYEGVPIGEPIPAERDAESREILRQLSSTLDDYSLFMSSYGCSVCGELYRSEPPLSR